MDATEVGKRLDTALKELQEKNRHLFSTNAAERSFAARLAMYLQNAFPPDVTSIQITTAQTPQRRKRCCHQSARGNETAMESPLALPDAIVHRRGSDGPNLLVVEMKKTGSFGVASIPLKQLICGD